MSFDWILVLTGVTAILTEGVMFMITHTSNVLVLIRMSLLFGFANGFSGFANHTAPSLQSLPQEIAEASRLSAPSADLRPLSCE